MVAGQAVLYSVSHVFENKVVLKKWDISVVNRFTDKRSER
jgi:hypothetical protein